MTFYRRAMSLSPGNEQYLYFGAESATTPGSRNLMGVASPAIDGLIGSLLTAADTQDFVLTAQALDRALTAGRYVIPFYQWNVARIAHGAEFRYPETIPLFGDWPGWQPDVWWVEGQQ
jgi:peptide/nickel transport system substrate-binding protein